MGDARPDPDDSAAHAQRMPNGFDNRTTESVVMNLRRPPALPAGDKRRSKGATKATAGGAEGLMMAAAQYMSDIRAQEAREARYRPKESGRASYRDQLPQATPPDLIPPTNPSPHHDAAGSSERVVAGNLLGPKIWTGTHFLPRFVRAAEVPGEGMCYFYDDGTHCKTVINGEPVNAHWGVTRAGKPRKRLAISCITCREKRIKCDPDFPQCVQCEKSGRVCKFKNAKAMQPDTHPETEDHATSTNTTRLLGKAQQTRSQPQREVSDMLIQQRQQAAAQPSLNGGVDISPPPEPEAVSNATQRVIHWRRAASPIPTPSPRYMMTRDAAMSPPESEADSDPRGGDSTRRPWSQSWVQPFAETGLTETRRFEEMMEHLNERRMGSEQQDEQTDEQTDDPDSANQVTVRVLKRRAQQKQPKKVCYTISEDCTEAGKLSQKKLCALGSKLFHKTADARGDARHKLKPFQVQWDDNDDTYVASGSFTESEGTENGPYDKLPYHGLNKGPDYYFDALSRGAVYDPPPPPPPLSPPSAPLFTPTPSPPPYLYSGDEPGDDRERTKAQRRAQMTESFREPGNPANNPYVPTNIRAPKLYTADDVQYSHAPRLRHASPVYRNPFSDDRMIPVPVPPQAEPYSPMPYRITDMLESSSSQAQGGASRSREDKYNMWAKDRDIHVPARRRQKERESREKAERQNRLLLKAPLEPPDSGYPPQLYNAQQSADEALDQAMAQQNLEEQTESSSRITPEASDEYAYRRRPSSQRLRPLPDEILREAENFAYGDEDFVYEERHQESAKDKIVEVDGRSYVIPAHSRDPASFSGPYDRYTRDQQRLTSGRKPFPSHKPPADERLHYLLNSTPGGKKLKQRLRGDGSMMHGLRQGGGVQEPGDAAEDDSRVEPTAPFRPATRAHHRNERGPPSPRYTSNGHFATGYNPAGPSVY